VGRVADEFDASVERYGEAQAGLGYHDVLTSRHRSQHVEVTLQPW